VSNVKLRIGGRDYTVACAEGEESHVADLGRSIDDKIQAMGASGQSEVRQLLFAALVLADELHEARGRPGMAPQPAPAPAVDPDRHAPALEALAERLEKCAAALEG